jgi:SAM-dependent methyltransferase
MIRGAENRDRVVANAHSILKPGGRFVCHFHNRFFRGLGRKRVAVERLRSLLGPIMGPSSAGDLTMAQAYGGAPLTLHHFTKREAIRTLETSGFNVILVEAIGVDGEPARGSSVYGWLLLGAR